VTALQCPDIADLLPEGLLLVSRPGTVLAANRSLDRLNGGPAEWVGRPLGDLVADPPEVLAGYLDSCADSRDPVAGTLTVRGRAGQPLVCHCEGMGIGPEEHEAEGIVLLRLTAVEGEAGPWTALKRRLDEVAGEVERSRKSAEELAEAGRKKDQFVDVLAHILRNSLVTIRTGLHILRLPGTAGQACEEARAIMERQVRYLTRLVDELLDMADLSHGRVQLRRTRLDLVQVAAAAVQEQQRAPEQDRVELTLEAAAAPVWVLGDAGRLEQVLANLLDNAVKFRAGAGRVTIRVAADPGRHQAVLSVCDCGQGIAMELLPHLFESRAEETPTQERRPAGLGLGLAVVKGMVELHGGTVQAHSAGPGRGAEFVIRLPLAKEVAPLLVLPAAPQPAGEQRRILIVEDNLDAAATLRILLELLGHTVAVAHTGPEGVQLAAAWKPEVVLCDIGLPELDGYGVAQELRRNPATAHARLIALTGYGKDEDRRRSREAGFEHHLVKPVDPDVLQALLLQPATHS
jgi:signal transduction histidine kinase